MSIKILIKRNTQLFRRREIHFLFLMIFILGLYGLVKYENIVGRPSSSQLMFSHNMSSGIEHKQVRILCLITTEFEHHQTRASVVNLTWASRCDKVMFVTDLEDPSLPTMVVDLSGRDKLWGKTKMMFNKTANYSMEFDWILKADHDTYIIMENLKNLLSHYNASQPLFAGAIYVCRSNVGECRDFDGDANTDEVYMTGGAGYVLSREAVRLFLSGHDNPAKCRPGNSGPEDVEMSRCLQRLGASFIDTRDKHGRNRFFHISGEDALSLSDNLHRPDIAWISSYKLLPLLSGSECCSHQAISFHHLKTDQMKLMEYMVYNLKPHLPGDEDLSPPSVEAIIPNSMLVHTDILEIVMHIRNDSLRKAILMKEDIDFKKAAQILFKETKPSEQIFKIGDKVALRIDLATQLPERIFKIEEVLKTWLILNNTIGNGHLCKIEPKHVLDIFGDVKPNFNEEQTLKIEENDGKDKTKMVKDDDDKKTEEQTSKKGENGGKDMDKMVKDDDDLNKEEQTLKEEEDEDNNKDKRVKDDDQKKEEQTSEKKEHENKDKEKRVKDDDDQNKEEQILKKEEHEDKDKDKMVKDDNQKKEKQITKKEEHEDKDKDKMGKDVDNKKEEEIFKKGEHEDNANQSERVNREVGSDSSFDTENKTQITLEEQVDQISFCA